MPDTSKPHSEPDENVAYANTDRELWREGDPEDGMSYYEPSIHVTEQGGIGINVGGTVYVRTLREWHGLVEQLETLRNCVEEYADLDNWEAVRSPETTSAWQKRWGHPTPWVDAQHALDAVSNPAGEPAPWTTLHDGVLDHIDRKRGEDSSPASEPKEDQ